MFSFESVGEAHAVCHDLQGRGHVDPVQHVLKLTDEVVGGALLGDG